MNDEEPRRFERRALGIPAGDLAAAIGAAHEIIETTNEDATRERAKVVVAALQRLQRKEPTDV